MSLIDHIPQETIYEATVCPRENWSTPTRGSDNTLRPRIAVDRVRDSGRSSPMLQKNPLLPPRPYVSRPDRADGARAAGSGFVSAEDFDQTGILAGVDPYESRYWWLPEMHGEPVRPAGDLAAATAWRRLETAQAARRPASRPTAAA